MSQRAIATLAARAFALLACLGASQANALIDVHFSGSWFNPAKSGFGVNVEVINSTEAAFAWYTYDNMGNQAWVIGTGTLDQTNGRISGPAFITRGMVFGDFTPAPTVSPWGTVTLTFTNCNAGTLSWTSNYNSGGLQFSDGSQPIERLTSLANAPCGPATGLYTTGQGTIGPVAAYGFVNRAGKMTIVQANLNALYEAQITVPGTATNYTFTGNGIASAGIEFRDDSSTTTFTGSGSYGRGEYLIGSYSGNHVTSSTFRLPYDPRTQRGAALSRLAGGWTIGLKGNEKFNVSATGAITNNDSSNCTVAGQFSVPDPAINYYELTLTVSTCNDVGGENLNGTYTGVGALVDLDVFGDNRLMVVATKNSEAALIRGMAKDAPTSP